MVMTKWSVDLGIVDAHDYRICSANFHYSLDKRESFEAIQIVACLGILVENPLYVQMVDKVYYLALHNLAEQVFAFLHHNLPRTFLVGMALESQQMKLQPLVQHLDTPIVQLLDLLDLVDFEVVLEQSLLDQLVLPSWDLHEEVKRVLQASETAFVPLTLEDPFDQQKMVLEVPEGLQELL